LSYKAAMLDRYLAPLLHRHCLVFGWGDTWEHGQRIRDSEVPILFSSAKIRPGISESHSVRHPIDIPERAFKVPASGGFTIHAPSPAIPDLFEDVVPVERDDREWLDLVVHYLSDVKARNALASRQRTLILERHTYFGRCAAIATFLGEARLKDALGNAKARFVLRG